MVAGIILLILILILPFNYLVLISFVYIKRNEAEFPHLAAMARDYLAIPGELLSLFSYC